MKKLLVLGATPFQVPIVQKAQAKGYYVITMDNIPGNHAHRISDETALVSITDRKGVLDFAVRAKIDGIITGGSDVGVATLGYVNDQLGLSGITFEEGVTLTRKDLFREFQRTNGLAHPEFYVFSDFEPFAEKSRHLYGKYFIKPADSSGSKGVTEIELPFQGEKEDLRIIFENAMSFTRCQRVILEAFIEGVEHGGDAFVRDGVIASIYITTKYTTGSPHFVPIGHIIPTTLSAEAHRNVREELEKVVNILDISYSPVNFDVMIDSKDKIVILEMSPRYGGNCIPQIIQYGADFDEIDAAIDYAVEHKPGNIRARSFTEIKPTGSRILGAPWSGKLKTITPRKAVLDKFGRNLLELVYDVEKGHSVSKFTQGNFRIGHFIATASTLVQLEKIMGWIEEKIGIEV